MALQSYEACFKAHTREEYEAKRPIVYAELDPRTEFRMGEMIYCKRCREPKIADLPENNFVQKCWCSCMVRAAERAQQGYSRARKMREAEVRNGDWNPFD